MSQRRTGGAEKVTEYYHRAVWAFIIGTEPRVYLDVEPLQPGEGEGPAAMRLLERVVDIGRWIDGVVVDSGYVSAPFLSLARRLGLHYIIRIKQERNHLRRRAEALCSQRAPDARWQERIGHRRLRIEAWDEEGLWSWRRLWSRVRVVVCHEVELAEAVSPRRQVARPERSRARTFLVTSYPQQTLPTSDVCLAYHRRWHIENNGIRQLKHEWHWNHAFVHSPNALLALWLLLAVAANLFIAFVCLRLLSTRTGTLPYRTIAEEMLADLRYLAAAETLNWSTA